MSRTLDTWLLWQLADSAFPTGGFAHSGGLEAAWQAGEIRDAAELATFLEASLGQTAAGMIPFLTAAHDAPETLRALDQACEVFLCNHVANRASRLQGRALANSAERIFGPGCAVATGHYHLAPVFGAVMAALAVTRAAAAELFFFQSLRGWLAAAVRLGVAGPMEAQALLHPAGAAGAGDSGAAAGMGVNDIANTAPLQEIWQGGQDRLYSRLFQS